MAESQLCEQRVRIWQSRLLDSSELAADDTVEVGTITEVMKDALRVKTGDGYLDLLTLQWPGKKAQESASFSQNRDLLGLRFS